jgi:bifunctional DNase/RNase
VKPSFHAGLILAPFTAVLLALGALLLLPSLTNARSARAAPPPGASGSDCRARPGEDPAACSDVVELQVKDVVPLTEMDSHAVVLITPDGQTVLPIFVDEGAAVAIAFRLAHREAPHPLAQDLLDSIVAEMGGQVTEVHIDDVQNDVYTGRVFIQQGERELRLKARPSDSIAMALKGSARILVTRRVLSQAGISREEIDSVHRGDGAPDGEGPGVGGSGPASTGDGEDEISL